MRRLYRPVGSHTKHTPLPEVTAVSALQLLVPPSVKALSLSLGCLVSSSRYPHSLSQLPIVCVVVVVWENPWIQILPLPCLGWVSCVQWSWSFTVDYRLDSSLPTSWLLGSPSGSVTLGHASQALWASIS